MNELKIGKSEGGPTAHVRFDLINGVPTEAGEHSAQRIPTLTTINFRGSAHVKVWTFLEKEAVTYFVVNGAAPHSKARGPAGGFKTIFKKIAGGKKRLPPDFPKIPSPGALEDKPHQGNIQC